VASPTDPIHQFNIYHIIPINIGGIDFSFTNASLFMVLSALIGGGFLYLTTGNRGLVPTRMQSVSEMFYEFTADMLREAAGNEAMRFFPFVFTLFAFLLLGNLLGMFPYFFTITAQVIVTSALALFVIGLVLVSGFRRHGLHFLKLFVPEGVPGVLLIMITPIEVMSFMSRPISLSIRLFGNMLAGHISLKVFAGFVYTLIAAWGVAGAVGAIIPLALTVALTGLEFLMAALQAYVFAVLTCIYLNDAFHPAH
jgi:F-type H+-transporting ATPase subunit a